MILAVHLLLCATQVGLMVVVARSRRTGTSPWLLFAIVVAYVAQCYTLALLSEKP